MVELDGIDSEQRNAHPSLVISLNILNQTSNNVVIFPITHRTKKPMPFHYTLYKNDYPFFTYKENTVQPECVRHISASRLQRYLGSINEQDIKEILKNKEYVFIEKKD